MQINFFELRRQILHIVVGILIVLLAIFCKNAELILLTIFVFGIALSILSSILKIPGIHHMLCSFERKCNKKFPGKGIIFFFLGSLIVLRIFPQNIALAAIIILTFGDPVAHFIGEHFGRIKSSVNPRKKVEGTFIAIAISWIAASLFVSPIIAFLGSAAGMLLEQANFMAGEEKIDDNLIIPIIAAVVMWLAGLL